MWGWRRRWGWRFKLVPHASPRGYDTASTRWYTATVHDDDSESTACHDDDGYATTRGYATPGGYTTASTDLDTASDGSGKVSCRSL